jgi:triacylglycerol esterase/lipase EstA (alpha/beta hydrolase family)
MIHHFRKAALGFLLICASLAAAATTAAGPAWAATAAHTNATGQFAPLNRPGPRLSVPVAELAAAVTCTPNVADAQAEVALFVPGTALDPSEFSWNWFRALDKINYPYCSVTLPDHGLGDIQVSSEYVVYAIRHIYAVSGHQIAVIGHSQGGLEPRFALRFWPDTRAMVADYVALGAPNHGSEVPPECIDGSCAPSLWQMTPNSAFIKALNSGEETFRGISYTDIYTTFDEYVQPNLDNNGTTSLHGDGQITNVSLQSVCAGDTSEHIALGTSDAVAYALTMDALTHRGPAQPARIDRPVCDQAYMPGVNPATYQQDLASLNHAIAGNLGAATLVPSEPPLMQYVFQRH